MIVYLLVAAAVYDHGVVGAYASEADAREVAERIWPLTDGHHRLEIRQYKIGETRADAFPYTLWENDRPPGPPRIETVDR